MNNLWIFGDNNSAIFGKTIERRFKYYKEYRNGIFPKTWSELLATSLNLRLKNLAVKGQSNYDIFDMVCCASDKIKKDDVVIIGWSYLQRFRLIDEYSKEFTTIRANQFKDMDVNKRKYLNGVELSTIDSILRNRKNVEWKEEIYNWEKLINQISKFVEFKTFYWTFDSELNRKYYLSTNDFRMDLIKKGAEDITLETNGKLTDDNFGEIGHLVQFKYFLNKLINE